MISTPSSTSPRANSTTPRLSETVISARSTRTSPGADVCTPGAVRTSLIDDHPARLRGIERDLSAGYQTHGSRQQLVLDLVDLLLDDGDVPSIRKVERSLEDDRAGVDALVDEMDGHARDLDAGLQRLLDGVDACEGRQQRRVDIDDRVREARNEAGRQQLHKPRQHDQLGAERLDPVRQRCVALRTVGVVGRREHRGLDAGGARPLQTPGLRPIRAHPDDLDVVPVQRVDQRLQVAALARDENHDWEAHAATAAAWGTTFSFGNLPPVETSRPASISSSTRPRMSA